MINYSSPDLTQHPPRSVHVRLGGFAHLPRLLDKARAFAAGKHGGYKYNCPLDRQFFLFTGVDADVAGRTVAIYDDMLRTGGSMIQAAEAYRDAGAARVVAFTTHLLAADGALEKMKASGAIERIVCTDSHPSAPARASDFVKVLPVAPLLAQAASREGTA